MFASCNKARLKRGSHRQSRRKYQPYLLRGLVYCYECCCNPTDNADFPSWGKMYCRTKTENGSAYYVCSSRHKQLRICRQHGVRVVTIDTQVFTALMSLKPAETWRADVVQAVSDALGEQNLEKRLTEIRETIERMDFRWDNGFITDKTDYLEKRLKLQQELEQLTPAYDELDAAVDLLSNFQDYWQDCKGDIEKQHELLKLIVDRVYVQGSALVAMTLKANYHFVLGHNANEPTSLEIDPHIHVWAQRDLDTHVYIVKFIPKYLRPGSGFAYPR